MTTKRKRKYSQDFSGGSLTDQSFTASCDVNKIIQHYAETGIHPHPSRLELYNAQCKSEETLEASTLSYEDAMRNKAALDSYLAENPAALDTERLTPPAEPAPDGVAVEKPAPQDASGGDD